MRRLAATALGLALCGAYAVAQSDARRAAEEKVRYAERLFEDSAAQRRIEADERARGAYGMAREQLARAKAHLAAGADEPGLRAVDEALQSLVAARRLAPDPASAEAALRKRYSERRQGAQSLLARLREYLAGTPNEEGGRDLEHALKRIGDAESLAASARFEQAGMVLADAERILASALDRFIAGRTIDYTPRFASPEEEYRHELARHRSLSDLMPLALSALKPAPEARSLAERYLASSERLQAEAQDCAGRREFPPALRALRESNAFLQRALSATGVVYPQ